MKKSDSQTIATSKKVAILCGLIQSMTLSAQESQNNSQDPILSLAISMDSHVSNNSIQIKELTTQKGFKSTWKKQWGKTSVCKY